MQITSGIVATDGVVFNTTYYDPDTIYAQTVFVVPIVDGNLSINTIINPNVSTLQFTDGNLSITTINTPNVFGPVFIGV